VLVQKMSKGELKSYDVTLAFCKRAAIAQQLVRTAPIMCLCAYSSRNHR
jgi:hypothetical protein